MKVMSRVLPSMTRSVLGICASWAFVISANATAQDAMQMSLDCPTMKGFGPYDYRTLSDDTRVLVEGAHFTPEVEQLIKGHRGYLGGDIDYTLRAFPNSPRALLAMMRLYEKQKNKQPEGARPLHCYFENAIIFRPDDGTVRMLYGIFLLKRGDSKQAIEQLEKAASMNDDDVNTYYNLGLAYFDLKKYDLALINAHKAYGGGFPLPGLRDKLKRVGKWQDPLPKQSEASVPISQSTPAASAVSVTK